MIINGGLGINSALSVQTLIDMRNQLTDLQRQLGTGKRADTYSGLGLDRGLTIGLRGQLAAMTGYSQSITEVGVRLNLAGAALRQLDEIGRAAKSSVMQSNFALGNGNQTPQQRTAYIQLDQMLSVLNTSTGGRYLFSGRGVDRPAVAAADVILNGEGTRAGLKQIIEERRQADVGAAGIGRLAISSPIPTSVQLDDDASPFGFKLAGATTNIPGATVTGPTGAPASLSIDFAVDPFPGDTIRFTFTLPDGSSQDLTLTATTSTPPGPNEFLIGGSPAASAANLAGALDTALTGLAATSLTAASAIAAGNDFFNTDAANPPRRVDGPPFDTATGLIAGTPNNTVSWYLGEAGLDGPRNTAVARVDQSLALSYGLRANEEGLRMAVQSIAVYAAVTYSASDPDAEDRYSALKQRVTAALDGMQGRQRIADIEGDIAAVHTALDAARERHQQSKSMLEQLLQNVEGAPVEEVAAKILALQTSLQATLQTTAILLRTNLLEYL